MASQKQIKAFNLSSIGIELDLISLERLEERYPNLAAAISAAIADGASPADIRRYALTHGAPKPWAEWLEQAARAVAEE